MAPIYRKCHLKILYKDVLGSNFKKIDSAQKQHSAL